MESDAAQLPIHERLFVWYSTRQKQVHLGAVAVLVVGFATALVLYERSTRETEAGDALMHTIINAGRAGLREATPESLLQVASERSGTAAGGEALILAGGSFYLEDKFPEAQQAFALYLSRNPEGPLVEQALLGVAASLEAQGKTDDAVKAYQKLNGRRPDYDVLQGQCSLARLYEAQNKLEQARDLYDAVSRTAGSTILGNEAGIRLHELISSHPNLKPGPVNTGSLPPAGGPAQ
jgi:tetratricopeptide (TPR) repeat protein